MSRRPVAPATVSSDETCPWGHDGVCPGSGIEATRAHRSHRMPAGRRGLGFKEHAVDVCIRDLWDDLDNRTLLLFMSISV